MMGSGTIRFNASDYLAGGGSRARAKFRTQAADSLPVWMAALANGECVETRKAVDAGRPFAKSLTSELGVDLWVWRRLRHLPAGLVGPDESSQHSLLWTAKLIQALGPDMPRIPDEAWSILRLAIYGLEVDPPSRMSLALAHGIGLEVKKRGWREVLPWIDLDSRVDQPRCQLLANNSGHMCMFSNVLRDLIQSANADRISDAGGLDTQRRIPVAIRNLYFGKSLSRLNEYVLQWMHDKNWAVLKGCATDSVAAPQLLPELSVAALQISARQLLSQQDLIEEGWEMGNCVATLWPFVATCNGLVVSLKSVDSSERASVFYRPSQGGKWSVFCGGPRNEPPAMKMRAAAHELTALISKGERIQSRNVRSKFKAAAVRRFRYWPGGKLYKEALTATPHEINLMRKWFPCNGRDPIEILRKAWPS